LNFYLEEKSVKAKPLILGTLHKPEKSAAMRYRRFLIVVVGLFTELSQNILEMVNAEPNLLHPDVWDTIKKKSKEQAVLLQIAHENAAKAK